MAVKMKKALTLCGVGAFWLLVWEVAARLIGQEILLPTVPAVVAALWRLWGSGEFWLTVILSLLRVLGGFAAAVVAGTLLAVLTVRFSFMNTLLSPLLHIVRAAPVASFIILAYFWIRLNLLPAFIAFLMVVPMVWANVSEGIRQTDRRLLEMARVFRFGRGRTLMQVYWPSVRPYFLSACTTGVGFAWKSGIAAEVICGPDFAIGSRLGDAKAYLETAEVFAWTVVVVLLSVLLERVLIRLVRRRKGGLPQ